MNEQGRNREEGRVRRVAETAVDVAVGGTAIAAEKAREVVGDAVARAEETLSGATDGTDSRPYEERTRDELYKLAIERNIEGRSSMKKKQLIAALRLAS
jgi:hypothetical protein